MQNKLYNDDMKFELVENMEQSQVLNNLPNNNSLNSLVLDDATIATPLSHSLESLDSNDSPHSFSPVAAEASSFSSSVADNGFHFRPLDCDALSTLRSRMVLELADPEEPMSVRVIEPEEASTDIFRNIDSGPALLEAGYQLFLDQQNYSDSPTAVTAEIYKRLDEITSQAKETSDNLITEVKDALAVHSNAMEVSLAESNAKIEQVQVENQKLKETVDQLKNDVQKTASQVAMISPNKYILLTATLAATMTGVGAYLGYRYALQTDNATALSKSTVQAISQFNKSVNKSDDDEYTPLTFKDFLLCGKNFIKQLLLKQL
jgi:gas vesicle protein